MVEISIPKIEELAKALTPVPDMAILLGIPESELRMTLSDPCSDVSKAFHKTIAEVALRIRQRDIDLADAGSPTAAEAVSHHLTKMNLSL